MVSVGMPGVSNADQFAVYALAATMEFAEAAKTAVAKSGVNGLTRRSLHHGGATATLIRLRMIPLRVIFRARKRAGVRRGPRAPRS